MRKISSIRVFISSTFDDMQVERDVFVQKVFPILRDEAEKRGVAFSYVDLRWGIRERTASEDVVKICMSEIENCRPFFIGLIGERYGWIPRIGKKKKKMLNNRFPGLGVLLSNKLSLTEIEMRYNLILNKNKEYNFFYFRNDDKFHNKLRPWQFRDRWLYKKKRDFSSFIREEGLGVIHEYMAFSFEDNDFHCKDCLAQCVYEDFMKYLNDYFPITVHSKEKSVRLLQESFMEKQKCILTNGVAKMVQSINDWIYSFDMQTPRTTYLLLTGERGVGKKTILSYIVRQDIPHVNFIYHIVGFSRKQETPYLVLSDLIIQICLLHSMNLPQFTGFETPYELSDILQKLILDH